MGCPVGLCLYDCSLAKETELAARQIMICLNRAGHGRAYETERGKAREIHRIDRLRRPPSLLRYGIDL